NVLLVRLRQFVGRMLMNVNGPADCSSRQDMIPRSDLLLSSIHMASSPIPFCLMVHLGHQVDTRRERWRIEISWSHWLMTGRRSGQLRTVSEKCGMEVISQQSICSKGAE